MIESWGDLADNLCVLVEKAYPELQEDSRDYLHRTELLSRADNLRDQPSHILTALT